MMTNPQRVLVCELSAKVRTLLVALTLAFSRLLTQAEDAPALEHQVQGAFLLKFALFVHWPEDATRTNAACTIGILGKDPFGNYLDEAIKKNTATRPVVLKRASDYSDLENCQVIFVSQSEPRRTKELLKKVGGKPILTVSDDPEFARRGGIIAFIKEAGRVRFEINVDAAGKAGLKLSAKLLQVGKVVSSSGTEVRP